MITKIKTLKTIIRRPIFQYKNKDYTFFKENYRGKILILSETKDQFR